MSFVRYPATESIGESSTVQRTPVTGRVGRGSNRGTLTMIIALVGIAAVCLSTSLDGERAAALTVLLASLVSSVAGFAFAPLAGSALAFLRFDPVQAVATMALCSIAMQTYAVWQLREAIRWRALRPMLMAGALTTPLGVAVLIHIDAKAYAAVLGTLVTAYGGYVLWRRHARPVAGAAWRDAIAGAIGGVVGGLSSAPGLVVTIWCSMRGLDKVQQRAVYQPFILAMQVVTIACLAWRAPIRRDLLHPASFVPFALLGAIGGFALYRRMSMQQFQAAVSLLLIVSGVGLLARAC